MRDFLIHITGKGAEALDLNEWEANPHARGERTRLNLQPDTLGLVSLLLSAGSLRGKKSSADRMTNDPPGVGPEGALWRPRGIRGSSQAYWWFPQRDDCTRPGAADHPGHGKRYGTDLGWGGIWGWKNGSNQAG